MFTTAQDTVQPILDFIIRLTHVNVWESMGKLCSCMQFIKSRIFYCKSRENLYQYYKSHENPYQVLQVTITRAASEHAMKSKVRMINHYHHSTKLYRKKNITRLLPLALLLVLCTRNNTNDNKLVIFFGIASYYGDNYILQ